MLHFEGSPQRVASLHPGAQHLAQLVCMLLSFRPSRRKVLKAPWSENAHWPNACMPGCLLAVECCMSSRVRVWGPHSTWAHGRQQHLGSCPGGLAVGACQPAS